MPMSAYIQDAFAARALHDLQAGASLLIDRCRQGNAASQAGAALHLCHGAPAFRLAQALVLGETRRFDASGARLPRLVPARAVSNQRLLARMQARLRRLPRLLPLPSL